jgi:putative acetyltransferase
MVIRPEKPDDVPAIHDVVRAAFAGAAQSSGTEPLIVDALRKNGALAMSLVAAEGAEVVGHIALSPVAVHGAAGEWFGIGRLSVRPQRQRRGIGRRLMREALERLRQSGAAGCVVLGDPGSYRQFGFEHDPLLFYKDVPPPYLQFLALTGQRPTGAVDYNSAFEIAG